MTETPQEQHEFLSSEAVEQLQKALGAAINKPAQARGFLDNIPDLSAVAGYKDKVLSVLDGVLAAVNTIQQYSWIIPAKYHEPIQKLEDALTKVKGWLD